MDIYLLVRFLHILAAIVVVGTGAGIAFFLFMAHREKSTAALAVTTRHVVLADWCFTAPAVVTQLLTGLWLVDRLGVSYSSPWLLTVLALFAAIGVCWLPVVGIQYKLRRLAETGLPLREDRDSFDNLMRTWTRLGAVAFAAILFLLVLMVFKPLPMS